MVGMERFIALDHLDSYLTAIRLDWIGLEGLQAFRDEVKAERQRYLDDPDLTKKEEAAAKAAAVELDIP